MTSEEIRRVIIYTRASTHEQQQSGLGLESQRATLEAEAQRRGWEVAGTYRDVSSGKSMNGRPELQKALGELKAGLAQGLLVTRVDRLSRSLADFAALVERARREGWLLIAVDSPFDMSTAPGRAMAGVMATFYELARELISERTRAALKVKAEQLAAEGKQLGRPRAISADAEARIRELRLAGQSYEAIAAALTAEGLPTPQGGSAWHWRTVYMTAKRLGVLKGGKARRQRRRRREA